MANIPVAHASNSPVANAGPSLIITASVWHRPIVSDAHKEQLAQRQANAAVALLRMNQAERVWPLLKHSPDPRLRTWIIHRLSPQGANPEAIAKRLAEEPDVSIRRALVLILGQYEDLAAALREALTDRLLALYGDDPDGGIHGAAEWVLRRWGKQGQLASIDAQLATGKVEGQRNWYVTRQGHTMAVLPGPVELLMGSPATQPDRYSSERLHRRRIGRRLAIASREVTVGQFQAFLREAPSVRHVYTKRYASEYECPQISVTWYEAAAYCRWLSEQEGIAEDQMCYPPLSEIKDGMKLPPDYLSRTGYRLPSEAEWEYACRAGAVTSRYYGPTQALLGSYAWYIHTANERSWPVASLQPNDFGLFDMLGNVSEWCQESYVSYSVGTRSKPTEDGEDVQAVSDSRNRVLRGGAFSSPPGYVRSANRYGGQAANRGTYVGFRPARTYNLSP